MGNCLGRATRSLSSTHEPITSNNIPPKREDQEETPGPNDEPQHADPSSDCTSENEMVITAIRATDVALGLRRLPAGFYAVVRHSSLEWRTENKRSSVNDDIEWSGPIPIPLEPSTTIHLEVYASFELGPTLGTGEQLRMLTITVEQLMDHSANDAPFNFFPEDGDVVSPCSSLSATVQRQRCEETDPSSPRAPHSSTTESRGELENATNYGHSALCRYRKRGERQDLERSIAEFERALSICPLDHPCRAAAQSNLALAKFMQCRLENAESSFDVPLSLLRSALDARPVGHLDRPSTLIQLAIVYLARFEKSRDRVDEAGAEEWLLEAMELSSGESSEERAAVFMLQRVQVVDQPSAGPDPTPGLTDLEAQSIRLLERFKQFGDTADLDDATEILEKLVDSTPISDNDYFARLQRQKGAVYLTPHGHPDKPNRLNRIAGRFYSRFERIGQLSDLNEAISAQKEAIDLTPHDHPDKPARLNNLGMCFGTRFERLGEPGDLDNAISLQKDAVDLVPLSHPHKIRFLHNLGISLFARFERLGRLNDLEDTISTLRASIELIPDGRFDKLAHLRNLGMCLRERFARLGELSDLQEVISTQKYAVRLTPHGHPDKPTYLCNLGVSLFTRFECLGQLSDLDDAIMTEKDAVDLTPYGHSDKPRHLHCLSRRFILRFERTGQLSDLESAISMLKDVVSLTPQGHPRKPGCLNNLGHTFRLRFERLGQLCDLENAIYTLKDAVEITPDDHPDKPAQLTNLGSSFLNRFQRLEQPSDLENAISILKDAVDLFPNGHPDKVSCLNNIAGCFIYRFEKFGQQTDLDDAILMQKEVVALTPRDRPSMPGFLGNLGRLFFTRFNRLGQPSDLDAAISRRKDAVNLIPNGHPDKSVQLDHLGVCLRTRFEHCGQLSDLEDAVAMQKDAVNLTPDDRPDKPDHLSSLGQSLFTRFRRFGQLSDLEDAVVMLKDAVDLSPDDHPDKPSHLDRLGTSYITRFERLGQLSDAEEAISRHKDAMDLIPHDHPDKYVILHNLGHSYRIRFMRLGQPSDLEYAISMFKNAVDLSPRGEPDNHVILNNLGISLRARFTLLKQLGDLEAAISNQRDAIDLTPDGHHEKPRYISNLGNSFRTRFEHLGQLSDLEDAISRQKDAVDLTPHGHPDRSTRLTNLGDSFRTHFECFGELSSIENAISLYSLAASSPIGPVNDRFRASQNWISCARRIRHRSLLHAYSVVLSLLPELAWIGLSLTERYSELNKSADIVREAAAAALDEGFPEIAVEWLEQGRSIVWEELFQLRGSFEELSSAHPDHARRLQELSGNLDHTAAAHEQSLSVASQQSQGVTRHVPETLQQVANKHRRLAIERDELLQEIRRLPGFRGFLLHKEYSLLRASAHTGPIVILNAAETRCDALIILADVDHVIHVPLPHFTLQRATNLQNTLKCFVRDAREGKRMERSGVSWELFLSRLWKEVVKPVLDAAAFSTHGDLSRIFWCPTGPFMFIPIHAAGIYDDRSSQPGYKIFDFVVSSYIPTLTVLTPSPLSVMVPNDNLRFLVVRQPPSDGLSRLPGVLTETKRIMNIINSSPSECFTLLESSTSTVEEVLGLLKEADWCHFACHGIQDGLSSGLCLADQRRLSLRDIIAVSRPRGGLAFLSACQTATGEKSLSDEAIHIAAAMLFAGYGGVIGTMWSISDRLAPEIASGVYGYLFRNGTRPDYREAARALHEAIRGVAREGGRASFVEWVPYIHVGL